MANKRQTAVEVERGEGMPREWIGMGVCFIKSKAQNSNLELNAKARPEPKPEPKLEPREPVNG